MTTTREPGQEFGVGDRVLVSCEVVGGQRAEGEAIVTRAYCPGWNFIDHWHYDVEMVDASDIRGVAHVPDTVLTPIERR